MITTKRITALILVFNLLFALCLFSAVADDSDTAESLDNFLRSNTYVDNFGDVASDAWYFEGIQNVYELGLMNGTSDLAFSPDGQITIAEAITIACRLYSIYHSQSIADADGEWYQKYIDYAVNNSIIDPADYADYANAATRAQFAVILSKALPSAALTAINSINNIPDVSSSAPYASAVYQLYNAGILQGNDAYGTFTPDATITRGEVAAIVARMADSGLRKAFTLIQSATTDITDIDDTDETDPDSDKGPIKTWIDATRAYISTIYNWVKDEIQAKNDSIEQ